jgi:hypothetical protein
MHQEHMTNTDESGIDITETQMQENSTNYEANDEM